ncbi:hypothetical protein Dimus_032998 [Dionaea muscipula]
MEISSPPQPQSLSPSSSLYPSNSASSSSSPEFEFWMVRNPSLPPPLLLSADQLFSGGFLLPLHILNPPLPTTTHPSPPSLPSAQPNPEIPGPPDPEPQSALPPILLTAESASASVMVSAPTVSKRWKDIFKKKWNDGGGDGGGQEKGDQKKEKSEKRRDRKIGGGNSISSISGGGNSADLININLWPFSRSRSAGNNAGRPKSAANRKVSSAPCSRSNSAGESKSRKWPSSPARGGVHLGRNNPVLQIRRVGSGVRSSETSPVKNNFPEEAAPKKLQPEESRRLNQPDKGGSAASDGINAVSGGGVKGIVLNLSVPMCIWYRSQSCKREEMSSADAKNSPGNAADSDGDRGAAACGGENGGDMGPRTAAGGGNLFTLRSLFTKKVH